MRYGLAFLILLLSAPGCCLRKKKEKSMHPQKSKKMKRQRIQEKEAIQSMEMESMEAEMPPLKPGI